MSKCRPFCVYDIISGITRGLSQGGNLAKRGLLASTQKKKTVKWWWIWMWMVTLKP